MYSCDLMMSIKTREREEGRGMSEDKQRLKAQVLSIINSLNGEPDEDGCTIDAWTYLEDVLDIEYIVNGKREYLGARVLVCFGGPNVWINTRTTEVEGYWWGETCILSYVDGIGLDEVLEELWNCGGLS